MKIECYETDGGFSCNLEAESIQDAAFLARAGVNGKKTSMDFFVNAHRDGTFSGVLEIRKRQDWTSRLKR